MPKQEPVAKTNLMSEPKPKTRQDCMAQHNAKCERIVHYLHHGKHQHGLTKKERVVLSQAKTMFWMNQVSIL